MYWGRGAGGDISKVSNCKVCSLTARCDSVGHVYVDSKVTANTAQDRTGEFSSQPRTSHGHAEHCSMPTHALLFKVSIGRGWPPKEEADNIPGRSSTDTAGGMDD